MENMINRSEEELGRMRMSEINFSFLTVTIFSFITKGDR